MRAPPTSKDAIRYALTLDVDSDARLFLGRFMEAYHAAPGTPAENQRMASKIFSDRYPDFPERVARR